MDLRVIIRASPAGQDAVRDTTVTVPQSGVFELPGLPAGDYTYEAVGGDGEVVGGGRFLVDAYSSDMNLPVATPQAAAGSGAEGPGASEPQGRPLRTHPLPYLIVLVLLSTEWVLRRRRGLR